MTKLKDFAVHSAAMLQSKQGGATEHATLEISFASSNSFPLTWLMLAAFRSVLQSTFLTLLQTMLSQTGRKKESCTNAFALGLKVCGHVVHVKGSLNLTKKHSDARCSTLQVGNLAPP